ncbi:MAG: fluoride efflux transporter CrcB [Thermaceae bacterium]
MERYLLVAFGGAIGAVLRYTLGAWLQAVSATFPYSTLLINVSGSLFIGLALRLSLEGALSPEARLFLAMGVLGGYTTFSTFSYELLTLSQNGEGGKAFLYAFLSLFLGVFAAWLGYWMGGRT